MRRADFCGFLTALFLLSATSATSAILALSATSAVAGSAPALAFGPQGLVGSGFSPGGQVIWFGLTKEVVAYEVTFARHQQVVPVDGSGQALFELGKAVPQRSLWVAVDLNSGAYAIATPPGFPLQQTVLPAAALASGGALADQLADAADYSEILLVRPGQGAWGATVGRGGALDESVPSDPALKISLDRLEPILASYPGSPQKAVAHDLLIVFHPDTMSAALAVVGVRP